MSLDYKYIPSTNIDGFPISKPRQYITNGTLSTIKRDNRFLFESNFCNLIRSVTDRKSFVVSYSNDSDTGRTFTVVVDGYVFTFNTKSEIFNDVSSVYAVVHTNANDDGRKELSYQDVTGDNGISYYKSFSLVDNVSETLIKDEGFSDDQFLLIWDKGKVPSESQIKFDVNSVKVTVIDGKH